MALEYSVKRVQMGFAATQVHKAIAVWAGYARQIDVCSEPTEGMGQVGIADAMQVALDHASKYALERDGGQHAMIPTVAGIAAVAGACGCTFTFRNLIWGHTQLDEEVNKKTNKHHIAAPSPSFCKASSARVLKSYNLPQVCPSPDK